MWVCTFHIRTLGQVGRIQKENSLQSLGRNTETRKSGQGWARVHDDTGQFMKHLESFSWHTAYICVSADKCSSQGHQFFWFEICLLTFGSILWIGDQPIAWPVPIQANTQKQDRPSNLKKSNEMRQYEDIYLLLNYSTCFGRPSRPSSGVHKTVVGSLWYGSYYLGSKFSQTWPNKDLYQKLQLQFYVHLMTGAKDARNM